MDDFLFNDTAVDPVADILTENSSTGTTATNDITVMQDFKHNNLLDISDRGIYNHNDIGAHNHDDIGQSNHSDIRALNHNDIHSHSLNDIGQSNRNDIGQSNHNGIGQSNHNGIGQSNHNDIGQSNHNGIGQSNNNCIGLSNHNDIGQSNHNDIGQSNRSARSQQPSYGDLCNMVRVSNDKNDTLINIIYDLKSLMVEQEAKLSKLTKTVIELHTVVHNLNSDVKEHPINLSRTESCIMSELKTIISNQENEIRNIQEMRSSSFHESQTTTSASQLRKTLINHSPRHAAIEKPQHTNHSNSADKRKDRDLQYAQDAALDERKRRLQLEQERVDVENKLREEQLQKRIAEQEEKEKEEKQKREAELQEKRVAADARRNLFKMMMGNESDANSTSNTHVSKPRDIDSLFCD